MRELEYTMNKRANYLAEQLVLEGLVKLAGAGEIFGEEYKNVLGEVKPGDADQIFRELPGIHEQMVDLNKKIDDAKKNLSNIPWWRLDQLANKAREISDLYKLNIGLYNQGVEYDKKALPLLDKFHLSDYGRSPVHEFIRDKIPGPSWAAYGAAGAALGAATTAGIISAVNHVREKKEAERQQRMMLESAEEP
jgi:hypothetical protein